MSGHFPVDSLSGQTKQEIAHVSPDKGKSQRIKFLLNEGAGTVLLSFSHHKNATVATQKTSNQSYLCNCWEELPWEGQNPLKAVHTCTPSAPNRSQQKTKGPTLELAAAIPTDTCLTRDRRRSLQSPELTLTKNKVGEGKHVSANTTLQCPLLLNHSCCPKGGGAEPNPSREEL